MLHLIRTRRALLPFLLISTATMLPSSAQAQKEDASSRLDSLLSGRSSNAGGSDSESGVESTGLPATS